MKKTIRKLVLRKETVRDLSAMALMRVIGGQETGNTDAYPQSRPKQCDTAAADYLVEAQAVQHRRSE